MKWTVFFTLLIMIVSCGSADYKESSMPTSYYAGEAKADFKTKKQVATSGKRNKQDKKIIKEADMSFEVKNYDISRKEINFIVKKHKGYISNERQENTSYRKQNTIEVRIPALKFDACLKDFEKIALHLDYKNISGKDITEEFFDIKIRLRNKKKVEQRYVELLKQAKNVKDILLIEEKLRIIREEIESKEGRLKYLNDKVSFSTISLNIYQKLEYKYVARDETSFLEHITKALHQGWKGFLAFIIGVFYMWPLIIISIIVIILLRRYLKRRKNNKQE